MSSLRKIRINVLILLVLGLCSCGNKVLKQEKMIDVLFDIHRTEACFSIAHRRATPEDQVQYYNYIFEKHGITKAQFEKSLDWYAHHPREWRMLYDELAVRSEEYLQRVENYEFTPDRQRVESDSIDTFDFWYNNSRLKLYKITNEKFIQKDFEAEWDGRDYFVGTKELRLVGQMRFYSKDTVDVRTKMLVYLSRKKKPEILELVMPADSVLREYTIPFKVKDQVVTKVEVSLIDSLDALDYVEMKNIRMLNVYFKYEKHFGESIKNRIYIKRRDLELEKNNRK